MATDTDVILMALQKERDELHDRIMQVDRIIKRVKSLEYSEPVKEIKEPTQLENKEAIAPLNIFPKTQDIKILILRSFDFINVACKQKNVQLVYNELSGNKYSVRESMRTLNRTKILIRIKHRMTNKGFMWAKADWIVNNQLLDKYKPEGFDILYKAEDLIFE